MPHAHFHVRYRTSDRGALAVLTSQSLAGVRRLMAHLTREGWPVMGWTRCVVDHGAIANHYEDAR